MKPPEDDAGADGWKAVEARFAALYPGQEPRHFGTIIRYRLGGPDPLDGLSAYKRLDPRPHWHFVTFGFSELYEKESDDPAVSGYGFELTFRLACAAGDEEPPTWALVFLQNLARYVFETGNVFSAGDHMDLNGPIALGEETAIVAIAFASDDALPPVDGPNGTVEVGSSRVDLQACKLEYSIVSPK